ncbi:MAG TPA: hypothetical protein VHS31_09075 [Tepidisphaeraceae bacterium]|jgi:hypothetical protein|nr:hypothetical protein [Tepidisphaeraceae bacterium]
MRWKLFNLAAAVSLGLCAATVGCWIWGTVHPTAWPCFASPQRTWFVRFDHYHLILSDQQMVPQLLPAPFAVDSTRFGEYTLILPGPPGRSGLRMDRRGEIVSPRGLWLWRIKTPVGAIKCQDEKGVNFLLVNNFYSAFAIPWWMLLLALAICPALWLRVPVRARRRRQRGECAVCGYDLRATPDRCPECGAVPREPPPHNPPMQRTGPALNVLV